MAAPREIVCEVCGAANPPTATDCVQCGVRLKVAGKGAEMDKLLEELTQSPKAETREEKAGGEETLDLDREIVDELLDSLLVETSAAEAAEAGDAPAGGAGETAVVEHFECPICGATVAADATVCPSCGARFATAEEIEAGPAPPGGPETGVPQERAAVEPAVSVSEGEASKVGAASGRMIDVVVGGTIAALIGIFFLFGMYSLPAVAANPFSLVLFLVVAAGGFGGGLALFRVSTSSITQADRLVKEGRYEDAIRLYDRAIRMGSRPATAWTSKGVAFKRMNRFAEALKCHDVALKLNPRNEIAWCNKGDILFRAGRIEEAIGCFDKAVEIRPRYAIAWNNKGAALARMGQYDAAKTCQDRAVALKPRYIAAWLNRGEVLARLGNREEAERCLERARALGA